MILLDTHVWVWWVGQDKRLTPALDRAIQTSQDAGIGVSIISCWEVAKLAELGKLHLLLPIAEWITTALAYPEVRLLDLTVPIVVESTHLPGTFHRDPADQIIVATARVHNIPLLTVDAKILGYPHVQTVVE